MIRCETDGPVGVITLARPEQRNALTPGMLEALGAAIAEVGGSSRAVLIRGEGKVFCAGFDLELCRESADGAAMRSLLTGLDAGVRAMRDCPAPVVIACQGAAIAGGCALVAGADFAVADASAKLGYPVVLLGVSPAVSVPTLAPRVGAGVARARTLDPGLISGEEAHRLGLVSDLVGSRGEVEPRARALAAELAGKPAAGLTATKGWLNRLEPASSRGRAGLEVSLALAGGPEERAFLGAFRGEARGDARKPG